MKLRVAPKHGVLLYDGDCGLCLRAVRLLQRAGARNAFDYQPFQSATSPMLGYGLDRERLERELHLITPEGNVLRGFHAVRRACWNAPLLWPAALAFFIPGVDRAAIIAYRIVATNRRLFSKPCTRQ